ncbi:hypothetical protein [Streptomyces sp. NPDC052015]|uniref:hypothetical protein n=1 Tax=Streptomyces sp. NPDC052015 TaxID=3154755 RepID=UPI0034183753
MSLHRRVTDSPSVQAALADAATLIGSAALHLARSAEAVDTAAASGAPTLLERARVRMDVGHASTCLRQAVLVRASGLVTRTVDLPPRAPSRSRPSRLTRCGTTDPHAGPQRRSTRDLEATGRCALCEGVTRPGHATGGTSRRAAAPAG